MDVMGEVHKWMEIIRGLPPRPAKMTVSRSVSDVLGALASKAVDRPVGAIDYLYGCPIERDDSLPPGAWRMLDSDGNVMHGGQMGDDDNAKG